MTRISCTKFSDGSSETHVVKSWSIDAGGDTITVYPKGYEAADELMLEVTDNDSGEIGMAFLTDDQRRALAAVLLEGLA